MCDPVTALAVGSAVASTAGAFQQAQAQKAQAEYQADVAEYNAEVNENNALRATREGAVRANMQRNRVDQALATQIAAFGAGGTDLTGSAADVLNNTATFGELDAQTIQYNADGQARGFTQQATNNRIQGAAFEAQADSINPYMSAGVTLLDGAASVAGKWQTFDAGSGTANYTDTAADWGMF